MAAKRSIRKKKSPLPLLLAGVLLAGGAAYYVIQSNEEPATVKRVAPERPKGKIAVPIFVRDLNRGAEITNREIKIEYYNPIDVPEDAVISPKVFNGRWLMSSVSRGDYIKETVLADRNAPKSFSGLVSPGQRIVIIPSKTLPGSMGYVKTGDFIDIYSNGIATITKTKKFDPANDGSQPGQRPKKSAPAKSSGLPKVAIRLVSKAEVLQAPVRTRDGSKNEVVLVMSDSEAIQLQLAQINNEILRYVFRSSTDKTIAPAIVQRDRDPRAIEVIKGTNKRTVMTRLDWRDNEMTQTN